MAKDSSNQSPYRKVSSSTWADDKVRRLTPLAPGGQALFLMLMVGPQTTNMPGVQPVGRMAFAEMLKWDLEAFDQAYAEAYRQGLVKADWDALLVFVPNAIKHNLPQSVNVVKSWAGTWSRVPECPLKAEAWHTLHDSLQALGKPFVEAFKAACPLKSEPYQKALPMPTVKATGKPSDKPKTKATDIATDIQEQEQEQEQEQGKTLGSGSQPKKNLPATLGVAELMELGVDRQHAIDWLKARKAKRLPLTQSALELVEREAKKVRITIPQAIAFAAGKSHAGFKAEWWLKENLGIQHGGTNGANQPKSAVERFVNKRYPAAGVHGTNDRGHVGRDDGPLREPLDESVR